MRREHFTLLLLAARRHLLRAFFLLPLAGCSWSAAAARTALPPIATILTDPRYHLAASPATLVAGGRDHRATLIIAASPACSCSSATSFPGTRAASPMLTLPLAFPGRGDRLHGDHAGRPAGPDRRDHAGADRREDRVRLFDGRPVHGLRLLLDPAHDPHRDGNGREARPAARGGGALARRLALARDPRRHHARAASRPSSRPAPSASPPRWAPSAPPSRSRPASTCCRW